MSKNIEDLSDDELYASYEAYKALLDAGLSKEQALTRTGLTAQIVKDFEAEEEAEDFKSEFEEVWDEEESDLDESDWKEENIEDDWGGLNDDIAEDDSAWDERY